MRARDLFLVALAACAPSSEPATPISPAPAPAPAPASPSPSANANANANPNANPNANATANAISPSPAPAPAPDPARPPPKPTPTAPPPSLTSDPLLTALLATGGHALKTVLASPSTYRFQVLYGIVREGARPALERHGQRVDAEYFFPASSMKVPIALATVDWMALARKKGHPALTKDATLRLHPTRGGDPVVTTFAREALRALVVSDNTSANRLLAIVGHREVHEMLWSLGLSSARVRTGFATGGDMDPAEVSPRIDVTANGVVDELPARQSDLELPRTQASGLEIGKAAIVAGRRVEGPLSFADKNAMRLTELQDALVRIVRPDLVASDTAGDAAPGEDLAYLKKTLGTLPSESGLAGFDRNVVADYQLVPFLRGLERVKPRSQLQIFSKVGQAFGFLIENAYVVDKTTGRSFFLAAAVYANPDETMNDDSYGYDATSFPALADVAEAVARHAFAP